MSKKLAVFRESIAIIFTNPKKLASEKYYFRKNQILNVILYGLLVLSLFIIVLVGNIGWKSSTYWTDSRITSVAGQDESGQNLKIVDNTIQPVENVSQAMSNRDLNEREREKQRLGFVINMFMNRRSSVFIYIFMILILCFFDYKIWKRIAYLRKCYSDRLTIENVLNNKDVDRITTLREILPINDPGLVTICRDFVKTLYNSFQAENNKNYFPYFFESFLTKEDEENSIFNEYMNRSLLWIIRLGIFGTLVGIMVVFYEIFLSINFINITQNKIEQGFFTQIKASLLGNSVAVVTSIAAHGLTLLVEFVTALYFRKENNVEWLNQTYNKLLLFDGFNSHPENLANTVAKINFSFAEMQENVGKFSKYIHLLNPNTEKMAENFALINRWSNELGEKLERMNILLSKVVEQVHGFEQSLNDTNPAVKQTNQAVNELNQQTEKLVGKMSELTPCIISNDDAISDLSGKIIQSSELFFSLNDKTACLKTNLSQFSHFVEAIEQELNELNSCLKKINPESKDFSDNLVSLDNNTHYLDERFRALYPNIEVSCQVSKKYNDELQALAQSTIHLEHTSSGLIEKFTELDKQTVSINKYIENSLTKFKGSFENFTESIHKFFSSVVRITKREDNAL